MQVGGFEMDRFFQALQIEYRYPLAVEIYEPILTQTSQSSADMHGSQTQSVC